MPHTGEDTRQLVVDKAAVSSIRARFVCRRGTSALSDKARRPESGAIELPMPKMIIVPAAACQPQSLTVAARVWKIPTNFSFLEDRSSLARICQALFEMLEKGDSAW